MEHHTLWAMILMLEVKKTSLAVDIVLSLLKKKMQDWKIQMMYLVLQMSVQEKIYLVVLYYCAKYRTKI